MRAPAVILLLLLAGCAGPDAAFRREAADPAAFARDSDACTAAAALAQPPSGASAYARAQAFNRAYGDCLVARGHARRPYVQTSPAPAANS